MRLRGLRERGRVAAVTQRDASVLELAGAEQRRARGPGRSVAWGRVGLELRTQGDELGQIGDRLDAADVRDPDQAVRVEVVAEQERGVLVDRLEHARPSVVDEVALVDRLEPDRIALVPHDRVDGLALGLRPPRLMPERAL